MLAGGDSQYANAARGEEYGVAGLGVYGDDHKSRPPLAAGARAPQRRATVPQVVVQRGAVVQPAAHGPEPRSKLATFDSPLHTGGWYIQSS